MTKEIITAVVSWPSAPLTDSLVKKALLELTELFQVLPGAGSTHRKLLQWSTYEALDHALTHAAQATTLSSSYTIRKALIRKHFLARCVRAYVVKHPASPLARAVPQTHDLELAFADELDDMWSDELWALAQAMDGESGKWWILKPGMADRGMGIRLFCSREGLLRIFEEFEEGEAEGADDDVDVDSADVDQGFQDSAAAAAGRDATAVVISQLRHFVIQEYLPTPLLLDPYEVPLDGVPVRPLTILEGHKFHLRAYCVALGALKLYLYTRVLALFSSKPYFPPTEADDATPIDLAPHLTNTSLQTHRGEEGVRLLDELVGCHILSDLQEEEALAFAEEDVIDLQNQMADVLAETFKAAVESPVHFQPLPNAFELYGIDFLVSHAPPSPTSPTRFQVKLLEVNAEPAIELTGPRLTWILEDLFKAIAVICVEPFFAPELLKQSDEDATRHHLRKCLDVKVRGSGG